MTRAAKVLALLRSKQGEWIDGPDIANAEVGGSEGLKRLRELRATGYLIEQRRHPDPDRSVWQYRLVGEPALPVSPLRATAVPTPRQPVCPKCGSTFSVMRDTLSPSVKQGRCPAHSWQTVHV